MFAILVALSALAGVVRADCDACIAGRCHSPATVISGFTITDQMAIDRMSNILYLQLNGNLNVAVSLDHSEIRLINMMRTTGMAVHQASSTLYLGTKETPKTFYLYDPASNTTEKISSPHPDFQDYSGNKLLPMMDADDWHNTYRYLENLTVSGLVVDKLFNRVYFVSNNTLFVHNNEDQPPKAIFNRDDVALSADKYGEVYVGDAAQKLIYKLDRRTEELNVYAAYKTGLVEEFIFEKNNGIISLDRNGTVVQWVPTRGSVPTSAPVGPQYQFDWNRNQNQYHSTIDRSEVLDCAVEPPSANFYIRQLETTCRYGYGYTAQKPGYSYGQAIPQPPL